MGYAQARLAAAAIGAVLLISAYHHTNSAGAMTEAANRLLAALTPEQRARAVIRFDDGDERLNWHYIPRERKGLPLREMTPSQKHLAAALLAAGLSQQGYIKACTIMSLEEVLRLIEKDDGERRNPEKYYFSIFGAPAETGAWGYRVEGHHLSQNYTVVDGRVAGAPSFFGANPAEVREGTRKGLRALAAEEDLGRAVLQSLDEDQRRAALVDDKAYPDILTAASRKAALEGGNMPEQIAAARREQVRAAGRNLWFAWAGEAAPRRPHYYRVQAPTFLIEYDDTQDGANHIHSVWRDFDGDFGADLLALHYRTSHR